MLDHNLLVVLTQKGSESGLIAVSENERRRSTNPFAKTVWPKKLLCGVALRDGVASVIAATVRAKRFAALDPNGRLRSYVLRSSTS
eukprot:1491031-Pyramimonas_sp.AAC.1